MTAVPSIGFLSPVATSTARISLRRASCSPAHRLARAARTQRSARMAMDGGEGGSNEVPPGKLISTALEISFRAVWLTLLTKGVGNEYERAITDFVVACIAARKAGYTLQTLMFELNANEISPPPDKPELQNIALNDQEKETRNIW
jgi:hypothetical protein